MIGKIYGSLVVIGYDGATQTVTVRCECGAENYKPHPITGSIVILTVAHLGMPKPDGTPGSKDDLHDVREENLAALCQSASCSAGSGRTPIALSGGGRCQILKFTVVMRWSAARGHCSVGGWIG